MKKPYLPNNWQAYKDSPPEWFQSITYDEFYVWKIEGWQLPSSVRCIIRVTDGETGKVKEHVYQRLGAAENKVQSLMKQGKHEFVIVDNEAVHHLYPKINAKHNNKADSSNQADKAS